MSAKVPKAVKPETVSDQVGGEVAVSVPKAEKKSKQTSFTVYKDGYPVRTYSVEQHGENAEELAKEFCAHSGDEVK